VEFQKLIDSLEDHEDVQIVYHNGELIYEGRKRIYSKISNGDVIVLPKPLNTLYHY